MDIEDIQTRIKIIYLALNETVEEDIYAGTHADRTESGGYRWTFGSLSHEELELKVYSAISHIAALKDILKIKPRNNLYEKEINKNYALALITDLSNMYKHGKIIKPGYERRSGIDPEISGLMQALKMSSNGQVGASGSVMLGVNGVFGVVGSLKNSIEICGEVIDGKGNKVIDIQKLFSDALTSIENFCKLHNIS